MSRSAISSNTERRAPTRRSRASVLAAVLLAAACFAGGRMSVDAAAAPLAAATNGGCDELARSRSDLVALLLRTPANDAPRPKAPERRVRTPPLHLATASDDEAAESLRQYEEAQGRDMLGLLRTRVRRASFITGPETDAEAVLMQQSDYLEGWIEAVVRTAPTLADDIAVEVENALCDPETSDAETMVYARLGRFMPEVTSAAGFECAFADRTEEDPVLWELIDALRVSGLPSPSGLDALAANARDERTLRRLQRLQADDSAPGPQPVASAN